MGERMTQLRRAVLAFGLIASILAGISGLDSPAGAQGARCDVTNDAGRFRVQWSDLDSATAYLTIERKVADRFWWRGRVDGNAAGTFVDDPTPRGAGFIDYRIQVRSTTGAVVSSISCTMVADPAIGCVATTTTSGFSVRWNDLDSAGDTVVRRQVSSDGPWYWRGRTSSGALSDGPSPTGTATYNVYVRDDAQRIIGLGHCRQDDGQCRAVQRIYDRGGNNINPISIEQATDGTIYAAGNKALGTPPGGLYRFDPSAGVAGRWHQITLDRPILPRLAIPLDDGSLYLAGREVASNTNGLWLVDPTTGRTEAIPTSVPLPPVATFEPNWSITSDDVLYFGTVDVPDQGVWRYDPASGEPAAPFEAVHRQIYDPVIELGDGSIAYAIRGAIVVVRDGQRRVIPIGSVASSVPRGPWPDTSTPGGFFTAEPFDLGGGTNWLLVRYSPATDRAEPIQPNILGARTAVVGDDGRLYVGFGAQIYDPANGTVQSLQSFADPTVGPSGVWYRRLGGFVENDDGGFFRNTIALVRADRTVQRWTVDDDSAFSVAVELGPELVLATTGGGIAGAGSFVLDLACVAQQ